MALELRNKTWGLALGDGAKRRQVVVLASARVVIETWRRRYNHVRPTQPAGSGHEVNI
jgi:hypothetical protein